MEGELRFPFGGFAREMAWEVANAWGRIVLMRWSGVGNKRVLLMSDFGI